MSGVQPTPGARAAACGLKIFLDSADLNEIATAHPWVTGFTTNPTLMRQAETGAGWAEHAVKAANGLPISIDGPESVWDLGPNVWRKVADHADERMGDGRLNLTAVCTTAQVPAFPLHPEAIVSVFAGRIMDTGRDPRPVIDRAKQTGAQVLWASVREPYNIVQAERAGCDIVTVPPAILRKWLDWHGKPLEVVAQETIAQFEQDREGLW
jgi:transaldolase